MIYIDGSRIHDSKVSQTMVPKRSEKHLSEVKIGPTSILNVEKSISHRRWLWNKNTTIQEHTFYRLYQQIVQQQNIPELVAHIILNRHITPDKVHDYLNPTLKSCLPDPLHLYDMQLAIDRLSEAVYKRETIGILGDYDVDGACATALMTQFLRYLGCSVVTHIPDRITEGYGPNREALDRLTTRHATLILCVDCGTVADCFNGFTTADLIVLDHHKIDGKVSPTLATINPNRPECRSGFHELCATGVAYMSAIALTRDLRQKGWFQHAIEPNLIAMLDLVALATICDVMPLVRLNRVFVKQGLRILARRNRPGLRALMQVAKYVGPPDTYTCGFLLGPRINAGGRIAKSNMGLQLLLAENVSEAEHLAMQLDNINRNRQALESNTLNEAIKQAERQIEKGHATIVLISEFWHQGIVGIIAGRIKERFNRPVLIGTINDDNLVRGSGRSVAGLDLGTTIIQAQQQGLLEAGGGHAMAAGFTAKRDNISQLHDFLDRKLASARSYPIASDLVIESLINIRTADYVMASELQKLAPFGPENAEPVLVLPHVRIASFHRIGHESNTLHVSVEGEDGAKIKALLFRIHDHPKLTEILEDIASPRLHLAGWLRPDNWNNRKRVSFFILDASFA